MSEDSDRERDREITEFWMQVAARGTPDDGPHAPRPRRRGRKVEMPNEPDPTDPLALIVEALRENADATQTMEAESRAARLAMAEAERKMNLRADTTSAEMRSLTRAVQDLTTSQNTIRRLKSDRYIWAAGGAIIGAALTSFAISDLPQIWQHFFG
jgi:hypothetical protein